MKPRSRLLAAAAIATAAVTTLAASPAAAAPGDVQPMVIYETGDYNALDVDYSGGALTLDIKQWAGNDDLSPATTLLRLLPSAAGQVPTGSAWTCLGPAGATVYVAPQAQNPNLLWLGWNTVDVPAAQGPVRLDLVGFEGPPGSWFTMYTANGLGGVTYRLNTYGGFGCPLATWPGGLATGTYGYPNWAFSHQGNYSLKFRATAQNGAGATSGIVTYTFHVG